MLTVVVHSSHCATVARVSKFDSVCRSSCGGNRCCGVSEKVHVVRIECQLTSETKNKSATNELSSGVGSSLDSSSCRSCKHMYNHPCIVDKSYQLKRVRNQRRCKCGGRNRLQGNHRRGKQRFDHLVCHRQLWSMERYIFE